MQRETKLMSQQNMLERFDLHNHLMPLLILVFTEEETGAKADQEDIHKSDEKLEI